MTDDGCATMLFLALINNRGEFSRSPKFERWIRSYRMPLSSKNVDFVWGGRFWTTYGGDDWTISFFYKPFTGGEMAEMVCDSFEGDHAVFIKDMVEVKLRYL